MTLQALKDDIAQSLKSGDSIRVATLRFLVAAITNHAITKYGSEADTKLTESDILDVIRKQVKTHRESIDAFTTAGRQELVEKEKAELDILESFLPKEISDEELKALLAPVLASSEPNFGLRMKQAMAIVAGRADGKRVAALFQKSENHDR